jgi:hypothetical protein
MPCGSWKRAFCGTRRRSFKGASVTAGSIEQALLSHGYFAVDELITNEELHQLLRICEPLRGQFGVRGALDQCPGLYSFLSGNEKLRQLLLQFSPSGLCVKDVYFDKPPTSNWPVYAHQDTVISVRDRIESAQYKGWRSTKFGVSCVPPNSVLEQMLTLRLHLDPSDADNGGLRVADGSHRQGILTGSELEKQRGRGFTQLAIPAGGMLIMRPLLVHSSSRSLGGRQRRVLHLEFAPQILPDGAQWARQVWWF